MAEFPPEHFIKICGVTNLTDAEFIVTAGADAFGLILAESSRQVSLDVATSIADATYGTILRALVFRNNSEEFIAESVDRVNPDIVQVHGPLSERLCASLRRDGRLVVKALAIGGHEFMAFDDQLVDAVLVDSPTPGSGETHSWAALQDRRFTRPLIAAGGLSPDNVLDTIRTVRPWGVDCASGVEASAGVKDPTLVARFIKNARSGFGQ